MKTIKRTKTPVQNKLRSTIITSLALIAFSAASVLLSHYSSL